MNFAPPFLKRATRTVFSTPVRCHRTSHGIAFSSRMSLRFV